MVSRILPPRPCHFYATIALLGRWAGGQGYANLTVPPLAARAPPPENETPTLPGVGGRPLSAETFQPSLLHRMLASTLSFRLDMRLAAGACRARRSGRSDWQHQAFHRPARRRARGRREAPTSRQDGDDCEPRRACPGIHRASCRAGIDIVAARVEGRVNHNRDHVIRPVGIGAHRAYRRRSAERE